MQILLTTTGTLNPVVLNDLGKRQFAHPTTDYDLLGDYSLVELMNSADLAAARSAGYITLTTQEGNSITTTVKNAPLYNAESIVSVPVDDSTRDAQHLLFYNSVTGHLEYIGAGELVTGRAIYSLSFFTSSSPYIEYSSTSWQVVAQFPYLGTDLVLARTLYVIGSRNGTAGTAEARIWDLTNSLEVAYISWTSADPTMYVDASLENLPTGPAVFELQVKKDATAASKIRFHSMVLY